MEYFIKLIGASLVVQRVKMGSIPGSGRSPGGGHGNPLQNSCLKNPTDSEAWVGSSPWGRKVKRN